MGKLSYLLIGTPLMQLSESLEREMREALGVAPKKTKSVREVSNPMRGYLIVLSVRGEGGRLSGMSTVPGQ